MSANLDSQTKPTQQPGGTRTGFLRSKATLAILSTLILLSFAGLIYSLYRLSGPAPAQLLDNALKLLQEGDFGSAAQIAKALPDESLEPTALAQKHLLIGVQARDAALKADLHKVAYSLNEESVDHLQKSQSVSFPNGYEGLGNYHLGMALFDLFRWKEAAEPLRIAAERWPAGRADTLERLIDIDLSPEKNDIESALRRISDWKNLPSNSADDLVKVHIKHMETLLRTGDHSNVIEELRSVPPDSKLLPKAQFVASLAKRQLSEKASESSGKEKLLLDALELHDSILKSAVARPALKRRTKLEQGTVLKQLGKLPDAISAFSLVRMNHPQTPEALAAGIHEIEALVQAGRGNEAASTLEQIGSNLGETKWYETDWLSLANLRERLLDVGNQLIANSEYPNAEMLSKKLPAFCDKLDQPRLESSLYEKWAKSLPNDSVHRSQRSRLFHLAAQAYELLMNSLGRSTEYDQWLWNAITSYQAAEEYQKSNRLLDRYLSLETRDNRPRGYFAKAQNYAALEKTDDAISALNNILDSSGPAQLIYEARLELAKIKMQKEDFGEATRLLQDCLDGDLRPESPTWREALKLIGQFSIERGEKILGDAKTAVQRNPSQLLDQVNRIEEGHQLLLEGIGSLEDYVRRYPDSSEQLEIQYRLANAYRLASYWPSTQLAEGLATSAEQTLELERVSQFLRKEAASHFASVRREDRIPTQVGTSAQKSSPPAKEGFQRSFTNADDLIRNSYFAEADLYFQDDAIDHAAEIYAEAAEKYRLTPEGIEARKQLAICQHRMGDTAKGIRTLQLTIDLLKEIPASQEPRFLQVTPHDRAGWDRHLHSLRQQWQEELAKK